jgi:hypothetical protein
MRHIEDLYAPVASLLRADVDDFKKFKRSYSVDCIRGNSHSQHKAPPSAFLKDKL